MLICRKPRIFDVDLYALAIIGALCALTWLGVVSPLTKKIEMKRQSFESSQDQKESYLNQLGQLEQITQEQKHLADRLSRSQDILADNRGMPEVIRKIGRIALASEVQLTSITPEEKSTTEHFSNWPLTLRLKGTFPQVRRFLHNLTAGMIYVRMAGLTIAGNTGSSNEVCNIDLVLHVFGPIL